jgi:O-acetyl-ADP-ribose deacetylase (regulator of RNase III)
MPEAVSDGTRVNRGVIRLIKDDVTDLEVDAFVFYARSDLALGSGFGGAITVRGGPTIQKELDELAPVADGEAVVTAAGKLKADHIIHAVGPKFLEPDMEGKLRTTVRNTLRRADEIRIKRLAAPAMGAGYYGIAPDVCARVMLEAIQNHLKGESRIEELVICVLDARQYEAFRAQLATLG